MNNNITALATGDFLVEDVSVSAAFTADKLVTSGSLPPNIYTLSNAVYETTNTLPLEYRLVKSLKLGSLQLQGRFLTTKFKNGEQVDSISVWKEIPTIYEP